MDQYRIEKSRVRVTVRLRGGPEITGSVFLVPDTREPYVRKLKDLLNAAEPFFPIEVDDGITVLQNKDRLEWCRYEGPAGPTVEILLPRRRVTLMLEDGNMLSGDLVADGPPDRRRVLDCMNGADPFLLLEGRDRDYLVRRDAVTCVPSGEEGEPRDQDEDFQVEERESELALA